MARRTAEPPAGEVPERIVDTDVSAEMRGSFLEYAYSVIYSRALPDARDGLKPVQRRILYQMAEMGLRPDRGHVKCARVIGEVMGKLHPHGDSAIYDALVRMAQPFAMRLPTIDGHGNFGSLDDGPAAMRYTECRLSTAAMAMTAGLDEDTVDFVPNYDGRERQPEVLPAAVPHLLVNGASGIAVGMATNIPTHNLVEVVAAAQHLLAHPEATLDEVMAHLPGPDFPCGGSLIGLDGVREAYATGRGSFRVRATTTVERVSARRTAIVVTELPFQVGPERVIEKIQDAVKGKLQGISDVNDETDKDGTRLVIGLRPGFNPEAVLEQLYRMTPMEESFAVNAVALVDGRPQTLGLLALLRVFTEHRTIVIRRRSTFRRDKAAERAHIVAGLLIALDAIDEVVQIIRSSADSGQARERLIAVLELTEIQAGHILDMPLRRLTALEVTRLREELTTLAQTIAELEALLADPDKLRALVSAELAEIALEHGTPRRTILADGQARPARASAPSALPLEVGDDPCLVVLTASGRLARTFDMTKLPTRGKRAPEDVVADIAPATARGQLGVITTAGRCLRLSVLELPVVPVDSVPSALVGFDAAHPASEYLRLLPGEQPLALLSLTTGGASGGSGGALSTVHGGVHGLALGTARGVVKRVAPDVPATLDAWPVIILDDDDTVIGATALRTGEEDLVFVTTDALLLRFSASLVRPQGRNGGGVAGIALRDSTVIGFAAVAPVPEAAVLTIAGSRRALPGVASSGKVTPLLSYPTKGRSTGGVRCQRFIRNEDILVTAFIGIGPLRASGAKGRTVELPPLDVRRDGSGAPLKAFPTLVGPALSGTHATPTSGPAPTVGR